MWIALACLFVDDSAVAAYLHGLTAVLLLSSHELDSAVTTPVALLVHK
jgi:hypothetical protein